MFSPSDGPFSRRVKALSMQGSGIPICARTFLAAFFPSSTLLTLNKLIGKDVIYLVGIFISSTDMFILSGFPLSCDCALSIMDCAAFLTSFSSTRRSAPDMCISSFVALIRTLYMHSSRNKSQIFDHLDIFPGETARGCEIITEQ